MNNNNNIKKGIREREKRIYIATYNLIFRL
jgi:hypothetical protein